MPPCAISKVAWVPLLSFFCRDICGVSVCLWHLACVLNGLLKSGNNLSQCHLGPCATSKVAWVPFKSFFYRDVCGVFVCLWQPVCVFVVSKDVNEAYDAIPAFPLFGIWTH